MKRQQKYADGTLIQAGDEVVHAGTPAVVIAVVDSDDYANDEARSWAYLKTGFILFELTTQQTYHYKRADEDIEFRQRAAK